MLIPVIWKCPDCQKINRGDPSDSEKSVLPILYGIDFECHRCHKFSTIRFHLRPAAYIGKIIEEEK